MDALPRVAKHTDHIAWNQVGDSVVILEMSKDRSFHELSEEASVIWKLCDGKRSEDEIAEHLSDEYDVDAETAKRDVHELLDSLKEKSLIVWQ